MSFLLLVLAAAMAADEPVAVAPGLSSASHKRRRHKKEKPEDEPLPELAPLPEPVAADGESADEEGVTDEEAGPDAEGAVVEDESAPAEAPPAEAPPAEAPPAEAPADELATATPPTPVEVTVPPDVAAAAMAAAMGGQEVEVQPAPSTPDELLGPIEILADPSHDPWGNPWPRTADGIAAAVQALLPSLETCASNYAPVDTTADESEASVQVEFTVAPAGSLEGLVVSHGERDAFTGCLSAHLARLQFAPGTLPQAVRVPVYVRSQRTVEDMPPVEEPTGEQAAVTQPGENTNG